MSEDLRAIPDASTESTQPFKKHVQGASFSRASNFIDCSCGWYLATDESAHGAYARGRFNDHVIDAMQDALVALTTEVARAE